MSYEMCQLTRSYYQLIPMARITGAPYGSLSSPAILNSIKVKQRVVTTEMFLKEKQSSSLLRIDGLSR